MFNARLTGRPHLTRRSSKKVLTFMVPAEISCPINQNLWFLCLHTLHQSKLGTLYMRSNSNTLYNHGSDSSRNFQHSKFVAFGSHPYMGCNQNLKILFMSTIGNTSHDSDSMNFGFQAYVVCINQGLKTVSTN